MRLQGLSGEAVKALLSAPTVARTPHFCLQSPALPLLQELPTEAAPDPANSVDKLSDANPVGYAFVVPKRLAKRAVTRNLIRRQMREVLRRHAQGRALPHVLIRQRAPFERQRFPSAQSEALRIVVRAELEQLLAAAVRA